jgi:hypothetical protein
MKRRVRERVAGASAEEDGEDADGAGRELIVVVGPRGDGRNGQCDRQTGVTGSLSQPLSHEIRCRGLSVSVLVVRRERKEQPRGRRD